MVNPYIILPHQREVVCRGHAAQQRQASMEADAIEAADEEDSHRACSGAINNVKPGPACHMGVCRALHFAAPIRLDQA